MDAIRKKKVTKMETTYVRQQEYAGIAAARKKKSLYRRLIVFAVFAIFVSYLMVSNILSQSSLLHAKIAQKQKLDKQFSSLKNQEVTLNDDIAKLNNKDYIAKYARKEFFLSNKGEIIFNIPDNKTKKQP